MSKEQRRVWVEPKWVAMEDDGYVVVRLRESAVFAMMQDYFLNPNINEHFQYDTDEDILVAFSNGAVENLMRDIFDYKLLHKKFTVSVDIDINARTEMEAERRVESLLHPMNSNYDLEPFKYISITDVQEKKQ